MKLGPNQQAWVDKLRSGDVKQASDDLQSGDCYCCLGVACVVAQDFGIDVYFDEEEETLGLLGSCLDTQDDTQEWLALRSDTGEVEGSQEQIRDAIKYVRSVVPETDLLDIARANHLELVYLNDELELSFSQIADVVEKFPALYFKESK